VALLRDGVLLGALALEGKGSRNEKLLPAVDWLLGESGVDRRQIELFAVTRGPGSFTGVRIGLATLQGLALALGRPVCAMSTHEALALGGPADGRVVVWDDAGRGEFYLSAYEEDREVIAPRLVSAEERDALAAGATVVPVHTFLQSGNPAAGCARRATTVAAAGDLSRYADATPIYVRLAEAEVKLQQKQA
jgi:tRNA threonylcarbamoyladenosine biosynthesis protein TsaB